MGYDLCVYPVRSRGVTKKSNESSLCCVRGCNSVIYCPLWIRPLAGFVEFYSFVHITILDLAGNNLTELSNSLTKLESLRECRLSRNKISKIPYSMKNMHSLRSIYLDGNEITCLPAFLDRMPNLSLLDVYDNSLALILCSLEHLKYLDMAFNYEEPGTENYNEQKENLRALLNYSRKDDYKYVNWNESFSESDDSDCEDRIIEDYESEHWDSDDYWTPDSVVCNPRPDPHSVWMGFVERQMKEGKFCPIDYHVPRVPRTIRYDPFIAGQFDDASSEEDN